MFVEYRGKAPRVAASAFIAPTAVLIGDVLVGEEASIWFGVVLRADKGTIRIGARSSIQDNAVVHASERGSTRIGNDVTVGHCAVLDDCTIEDGALIGSNAVVLNGALVGTATVVAAGSVVTAEEQVGDRIVVAMADPTNLNAIDDLKFASCSAAAPPIGSPIKPATRLPQLARTAATTSATRSITSSKLQPADARQAR